MMTKHNIAHAFILILSVLAVNVQAQAKGMVTYTPGLIEEKLEAGDVLLVDYAATWCSTCAKQMRVLTELRNENEEYDEKITFIKVDWDDFESHEVTTSRNIPRRSTLLLLKGEQELGRIVAGTSKEEIKALLDLAL